MNITPIYDTIVTFGCWNQTHTSLGVSDSIERVMAKLKKTGKDVVLVSGDNYYPVKTKGQKLKKGKMVETKVKTVNLEQLKKGFKYLKDATQGTPVFMNLGNHDVVSNDQIDVLPDTSKECVILDTELKEENSKFHIGMTHKINYGNHTLIIMIDTSIYSSEDEFAKYIKCYQQTEEITQQELKEQQKTFVQNAIDEFDGENVIIVGHYPLFYEKEKITIKADTVFYENKIKEYEDVLKKLCTPTA